MAELKSGQIEVNGYRIDRSGLWSGERRPVRHTVFDPGGKPAATKNDRALAAGDGRAFGITTLTGRDVAIEMTVDTGDIVSATRALNDVAAVWSDPSIRLVPDVKVPLRYRPFPGLPTRIMYGRPDKFDIVNNWALEVGRVDIVASFETDDPLCWQDPELVEPVVIPITPPLSGGFTAPFTAPIHVGGGAEGFGEFFVGGSAQTPLIARIYGPITTPVLDYLGRWKLTIATSLLYDQYLDIDARPQHRTVIRSDGLNLSGKLTISGRATGLSELLIWPGPGEMVLRGIDSTGTARAVLTPQAAADTPYF